MKRFDPTRTTLLRRQFEREIRARFVAIRKAVVKLVLEEDAFGLERGEPTTNAPGRFAFTTDDKKLAEFGRWLTGQIADEVLEVDRKTGKPWTGKYVQSAYKKGLVRGYLDARAKKLSSAPADFAAGAKAEFLRSAFMQPERLSKVRLLGTRAFEELRGVSATMATKLNRALANGMVRGDNPRAIARVMAKEIDGLSRSRALLIARTEVIHAHAEGQLDSFEDLGVEHVGAQVEFSSSRDDRVCFPAGTFVETSDGDRLIETVRAGDLVLTRKGLRRVIRTHARPFRGRFVEVVAGSLCVVATEKHPFWTTSGWLESRHLSIGDTIQAVGDELLNVDRVRQVDFSDSNYTPSGTRKERVLPLVAIGLTVPVGPVHLNRDTDFREQEVNSVAPDAALLDESQLQSLDGQPHGLLDRCLGLRSPIAGEGAKAPLRVPGSSSELLLAGSAGDQDRRAPAALGAVTPIEAAALVGSPMANWFPATFAGPIGSPMRCGLAGHGTKGEAVLDAGFHAEGLRAVRADLSDCRDGSRRLVAGPRAVLPSRHIARSVEDRAARIAGDCFAGLATFRVAAMRAKTLGAAFFGGLRSTLKSLSALIANVDECHELMTSFRSFYHSLMATPTVVFNLEVEAEHEYFANGFLVHNCSECEDLDGKTYSIDEARGVIPVHPNCRCAWIPAEGVEIEKTTKKEEATT